VIGLLLALYPSGWRRRYGEEFRVVLESRPLGPFDVADVLIGALDARLSLRLTASANQPEETITMLRLGGYGAIAGGVLWVVGWVGGSTFRGDPAGWLLLVMLGMIGLLLALIGLSAFQAREDPRLAWAAFVIPALGGIVSLVGLYGMTTMGDSDAPMIGDWDPWSIWAVGSLATLVGCVLFGAATLRASVLSRRGAGGLVASSAALAFIAAGTAGGTESNPAGAFLLLFVLLGFAASWVALGASALRRGPIRAIASSGGA